MDCDKIVEKYLLIQNPLYTFSFPISVLVAIIVFGIAKAYNWSNNSYINQILIPILALLITMILIDLISRLMINKENKFKLVELCKIWMHDPKVKGNPMLKNRIDMNKVVNYKIESFTDNQETTMNLSKQNGENMHNKHNMNIHNMNNKHNMNIHNMNNQPSPLIDEIPNVSPFPLESRPNGNMCIENSNGCNLCSGSDQNPDNIVSPIPGPQWLPQNAEYVQNRLMNNNYTASVCPIK